MPIPAGVTIPWPNTVASIPAGWMRVTALDSLYVRAIPDDETEPGNTGGSADHEHTTAPHAHDLSHGHGSKSTPTITSTLTLARSEETAKIIATTHNHTFSLTSTSLASQSAAPGTDAVDNDPQFLEVIWIESDGSPDTIPAGALMFCAEPAAPEGFVVYTAGDGLFLKGAATAQDGGATDPGTLAAHVHEVDPHTHVGAGSHNHPGGNTSPSTNVSIAADGGGSHSRDHVHTFSVGNASTGDLGSGSGGNTGASSPEPPYINLLILESEGSEPNLGAIAIWLGQLEDIPEGWMLCNGENDSPNLCQGLFAKATAAPDDVLDIGGSETHSHAQGDPHAHTISSHNHAVTFSTSSGVNAGDGSPERPVVPPHGSVHNTTSANAADYVGSASVGTISTEAHVPEYVEVAFIIFQQSLTKLVLRGRLGAQGHVFRERVKGMLLRVRRAITELLAQEQT